MHLVDSHRFVPARYPVELDTDEIQLWRFDCASGSDAAGCVSSLLGAYLHCAPQAVATARGEFGKPYLLPPAALEFNVSHSGGALLVGISRTQALGVDIETVGRRRPALDLAQRFFAAEESAALRELAPERQQPAFLELWSCKEAVVKALGRGIGFGLSRLSFGLDEHGTPIRLNVIDASAGDAAEWHIVLLRPTGGHTGAVAWRGADRPIRAFVAAPR